jgi:DNA-binding NarL/FixJ family response regulator
MPELVLLDLAMPRMGGFDFLSWMRQQRELSSIPVVVLTGSALLADAKRAYQLGANSFLTKPADLAELALSLKDTTDYWLSPRTTLEPRAFVRGYTSDIGMDGPRHQPTEAFSPSAPPLSGECISKTKLWM